MFHPTTITHGQPVEDVLQKCVWKFWKVVQCKFLWGVYEDYDIAEEGLISRNGSSFTFERKNEETLSGPITCFVPPKHGEELRLEIEGTDMLPRNTVSLPSHLYPVRTYRSLDAGLRTDEAE